MVLDNDNECILAFEMCDTCTCTFTSPKTMNHLVKYGINADGFKQRNIKMYCYKMLYLSTNLLFDFMLNLSTTS